MKNILIVEDDKVISDELKNLLDNAGYNGIILKDFDKEAIYLTIDEEEMHIPRKEIVQIKTVFDWDNIE